MSKGINFVCENDACPNSGTRLTLHGSWPIAKIDDIVASGMPLDSDFREALAKRASEGRTYACVSLPNDGFILVQGIRVQAYCPKCVIVWDEDILSADYESEEEFRLAVDGLLGEPPTCRCGARRVTVENIGEGTLPCPACGAPMMREGWMVKQVKVRKP